MPKQCRPHLIGVKASSLVSKTRPDVTMMRGLQYIKTLLMMGLFCSAGRSHSAGGLHAYHSIMSPSGLR